MSFWRVLFSFLAILLITWFFTAGIGGFLVVEDDLETTDALYILSGNPMNRGKEAARIFHAGHSQPLVCLGGEKTDALEMYGIQDHTAEQTRRVLKSNEVPDTVIRILPEGSSTFEEFEAIRRDCKKNGYHHITVVSSRFHTRRIHAFFRYRLAFDGIQMCLRGAHEQGFQESEWWKSEEGLLFVYNEYIKMAYYFLKY